MTSPSGDADIATAERPATSDPVGAATLELLETHSAYTDLIWRRLRRLGALSGKVLEVGCGIGTISQRILAEPGVTLLHSVDVDEAYITAVRARIDDTRFTAFCSPAESFTPPDPPYDRAVSSNVFEHIEDDLAAMRMVEAALAPGGELWILVPAHPALYSGLDAGLSHHRRYTRRGLIELGRDAGLECERIRHFNPIGAVGWWIAGKLLRRRELPPGQVSFYDRFGVTISALADRLNPFPIGISLVARFRKR